jgi:hypothetical protein
MTMTSATQSVLTAFFAGKPVQDTTGGDRALRPGPIFIHDAVIPFRGETLLLALWRAAEARRNRESD